MGPKTNCIKMNRNVYQFRHLGCIGSLLHLSERHTHHLQQVTTFVVRQCRSNEHNVHALRPRVFIRVQLREHQLLHQPHAVITASIERFTTDPAKVTHPWQNHRYQSIHELVHALATQGHHTPDWHTFTQTKTGDRISCQSKHRSLTSDIG